MNGLVFLLFLGLASTNIYYDEKFHEGWRDRWVFSKSKESEGSQGKWGLSAGEFYNDAKEDKGLHTTEDSRFYQASAKIAHPFSNKGKDLVLQYTVKHEQKLDCGGGYIKIHPSGINQETYNGDTAYNVMFGPDICGSTKKTHLIFTYKGTNHLVKREIRTETDEFTHVYTLILHPDNTYEVLIDGTEAQKGNLAEDFDMLLPKEIKDPAASKPSDWVDEAQIPDPTDVKPEGWDDIPKEIRDPDATKPEDWDDELDGEWEAPKIDNPAYKGEWHPKMIENPAYKGEWVHPLIPNPDFKEDPNLYLYEDNAFVGFELWQVKAGSIFDNILITDSVETASTRRDEIKVSQEGEKKMHEKHEEEKKAREDEERKKREAEEKDTEKEVKEEEKEGKDEL